VDWITAQIGARRLYQVTGSMMLTGFTAPKIIWVREHEPEVYAHIAHILLPKDYIRYRLSGAYITDVADGSGFALFDVARRTWSEDILSALDLPRAWFPEVVESPAVCAHVSAEAAAETGLKAGTPIVGGAGDQPAGGVGSGIVAAGQMSLAVGTSGVAFAASSTYSPHPDGLLHTFCHAIPGTWFHMGVMLSAAGSFRWLHEELAPGMSYDELNARAASVPPGSLGLLFAPYLTGERHPHYDPLARGAFVGLTLRHGLSHLIRAVMEGVAFGMRDLVELLRAQGTHPSEAVVGGGAANSPVWRQLITDIMGIPLYTVNTTEGAALGAAILASVGAGAWPDVPSACQTLIRKESVTEPDPGAMAAYEALYPAYRALYPALRETFSAQSRFEG
jgi:xylulokinase